MLRSPGNIAHVIPHPFLVEETGFRNEGVQQVNDGRLLIILSGSRIGNNI
jgi:hypothetical protein